MWRVHERQPHIMVSEHPRVGALVRPGQQIQVRAAASAIRSRRSDGADPVELPAAAKLPFAESALKGEHAELEHVPGGVGLRPRVEEEPVLPTRGHLGGRRRVDRCDRILKRHGVPVPVGDPCGVDADPVRAEIPSQQLT